MFEGYSDSVSRLSGRKYLFGPMFPQLCKQKIIALKERRKKNKKNMLAVQHSLHYQAR